MHTSKYPLSRLITALVAAGAITMVVGCSSSSSSTPTTTAAATPTQLSGTLITAVDGYMIGCTVTDSATPTANVAAAVNETTSPGVYEFPASVTPVGAIISSNCTDKSTGKSVPTLKTPAVAKGAKIIASPIAAMVQSRIEAGKTPAEANAEISASLGLDATLDLGTYDPIADMATNPQRAAKAQAASAQIVTAVKAIEAAAPGSSQTSMDAIASAAATSAATPPAAGVASYSLADTATIQAAATAAGVTDSGIVLALGDTIAATNLAVKTASEAVTALVNTGDPVADAITNKAAANAYFVKSSAAVIVADTITTQIKTSVTNGDAPATITANLVTAGTTVVTDIATTEADPAIVATIEAGFVSDTNVTPTTIATCTGTDGKTFEVNPATNPTCPTGAAYANP